MRAAAVIGAIIAGICAKYFGDPRLVIAAVVLFALGVWPQKRGT